MSFIKCPKCGNMILDSSRKCQYCGFDDISSYLLNKEKEKFSKELAQRKIERAIRDNEINASKQNKQTSNNPKITCPYCKSTNCKKIGTLSRIASIGFLGFASNKIGKQWHCNNCGSDF